MHLTIVGTGYVGLVTGTCLSATGNRVTCVDIDAAKIELLRSGRTPIYEPGLAELLSHNIRAGRLHFTTDLSAACRTAQVVFICVGTPALDHGRSDLSAVFAVAKQIGASLHSRSSDLDPPVIVMKSTVPVGTTAQVKRLIAAETDRPFLVASNPEFLKEGDAINDFTKPDRIVIGVETEDAGKRLSELYAPFVRQGNPIFVMDILSSEMVKYAANTMLATKVSFINEIANLCEAYGADIDQVRRGMCADERIGNKFLYPGLGFGGSCFPKDVAAGIVMGRDFNVPVPLLEAVEQVNRRQRLRFVEKIERHFGGEPSGRRFAVWGLSFKPGTDDLREAPSITIIERLLEHGAAVTAYDPVAMQAARGVLGERAAFAASAMDALDQADALVICTEWPEFRTPLFDEMRRRMAGAVIFDGRNLYAPATVSRQGFIYYSVGRAVAKP